MVLADADAEGDVDMEDDVAGTAYREALTSTDGFTRGANGRVKFNKDTKKRRRDADEDVEMGDAQTVPPAKKDKKRTEPRLGHEFKAKVSVRCLNRFPHVTEPYCPSESRRGRQEGRGGPVRLLVSGTSGEEEGKERTSWGGWKAVTSGVLHRCRYVYLVSACIMPVSSSTLSAIQN